MRLLIASIFITFAFTGCKKDCVKPDDNLLIPSAPRPPQPMIKTITYTDYQGKVSIYSYYYDSLWRLSRRVLEQTNPVNTYIDSFQYHYPYIICNNSAYYELNADSLVYRELFSTAYSNKTCTINSGRYQVHVSSMVGTGTRTYNSNNNVVEEHIDMEAGLYSRIYYHYYHTYNTQLNTIDNNNTGGYQLGKSSVNLIEHTDYDWYFNTSDSLMDYVAYTYSNNDSGWVSRLDKYQATLSKTYIDTVSFAVDTTYNHTRQEFTYY